MSAPTPMMMPPMGMPGMMPGTFGQGGTQTVVIYQIAAPAPAAASGNINACFILRQLLRPFFLLLLWAGWIIYIAGTAKLQNLCNAGELTYNLALIDDLNKAAILLEQPSSAGCTTYFALLWWSVWLQFTTILLLTVTRITMAVRLPNTEGFLHTCLYFFIMSNILMFFQANTYVTATYLFVKNIYGGDNSSDFKVGCTLAAVGAIVSLIFNFMYIIYNTHSETGAGSPGVPGMGPGAMGPPGGPPHTDGDAFLVPADVKPKPVAVAPAAAVASVAPHPLAAPHAAPHADPELELASSRLPTAVPSATAASPVHPAAVESPAAHASHPETELASSRLPSVATESDKAAVEAAAAAPK